MPTARPTFMPTNPSTTTPATTKSTKKPFVKRDLAFDGRSHATFPRNAIPWDMISESPDNSVEINIKLNTQSSSGLLFLQGTRQPSFLSIGGKNKSMSERLA